MSTLDLTFDPATPGLEDMPVAVEVLDGRMRTVGQVALSKHAPRTVPVTPGAYAIRASLPSGERIDRYCTVADERPVPVALRVPAEPPEPWLGWTFLSQRLASPERDARLSGEGALSASWLRLWVRDGDHVSVVPLDDFVQNFKRESAFVWFRLVLDASRQCLIELGRPGRASRIVALPPSPYVDVVLHEVEADGLPEMFVSGANHAAEALQRYIDAADLRSAQIVGDALANDLVEDALHGRSHGDAASAAIGAYYLLRRQPDRNLADQARKIDERLRWMADWPVIRGWALLGEPEPDVDEVLNQFVTAAERGVPRYTQGLRLLHDGLSLFASGDDASGERARFALRDARGWPGVARFAAAAEPFVASTTFMRTADARMAGGSSSPDGAVAISQVASRVLA